MALPRLLNDLEQKALNELDITQYYYKKLKQAGGSVTKAKELIEQDYKKNKKRSVLNAQKRRKQVTAHIRQNVMKVLLHTQELERKMAEAKISKLN